MTGRRLTSAINGMTRSIYDGVTWCGTIVEVGGQWKSVARGGLDLGIHPTAARAADAVLRHFRAATVAQ